MPSRPLLLAAAFALHAGSAARAAQADSITRFDFDGDWRGDNNWQTAEDPCRRLPAYIYHAVGETTTDFSTIHLHAPLLGIRRR